MSDEKQKRSSYFVIVVFPNVLFFIVLGIMIYLWFLFRLPWLFFPGYDVSFPLRLIELIFGYLMTIGGLYFFTWGLTSITRARASGQEIGKTLEYSTLITSGAFANCRHPITLGFIFLLPGMGFIFDLIPLILMTFIYNPMLIALLYYEEKELNQRFGESYKDYKKKVPFLIPRFKKND